MKTYINSKGEFCSDKPEIFAVGVDDLGKNIYNNDIVYHYTHFKHCRYVARKNPYNPYPRFEFLDENYEGYNKTYFDNTIKVYKSQVPHLLSYLARIIENYNDSLTKLIPNINDIIVLKSHNYEFKVIDNKYKLFLKVQSVTNPNWIEIKPIYEFKNRKDE
jgi:hypothetical protein